MKEKKTLCWNVFLENYNEGTIYTTNIFELSARFQQGFITQYKKHKKLTEEFFEGIRMELMCAYWCKVEYEIIITPVIKPKQFRDFKTDIYTQVMLNWDAFKTYLLANEHLIKQYSRKKA